METTTDTLKYPLSVRKQGKSRAKIERKQKKRNGENTGNTVEK